MYRTGSKRRPSRRSGCTPVSGPTYDDDAAGCAEARTLCAAIEPAARRARSRRDSLFMAFTLVRSERLQPSDRSARLKARAPWHGISPAVVPCDVGVAQAQETRGVVVEDVAVL